MDSVACEVFIDSNESVDSMNSTDSMNSIHSEDSTDFINSIKIFYVYIKYKTD